MTVAATFLDAALGYAVELGWPVFVLAPRRKTPAIPSAHPAGDPKRGVCKGECGRDGHGLHDATTDPDTIRRWWGRYPNGNIGLRTGIAFDVLDVDGSAGQQMLVDHLPTLENYPLGFGPWSMTPGKNDDDGNHLGSGDHLLYLPTGRNRAGFLPHLDWRGDGGYIAAPPSVHPDGHGAYEWAIGPECAIEAAPAWLLELVWPTPTSQPERLASGPPRESDPTAYGTRALESEIGRLAMLRGTSGTRNDALNAAAFNLGQLVASGILDAPTVVNALVNVALGIGLSEAEAEQTIRSGLRSGLAKPRRMPA